MRLTGTTASAIRLAALLLALLGGSPALAGPGQSERLPEVGHPAPEISVERYVQGPPEAPLGLAALRGKVVVLDFWASWCPGCIDAVDHVNSLAQRFAGDPVVFLTLVNEPERTIRAALERWPLDTWVAMDADGATTDAYRIAGYPQAVLVDRQGRIAAFVNPADITADALDALLAGRPVDLPHQYFAHTGAEADLAWDEEAKVTAGTDAVSQVVIRRSAAEIGGLRELATPGRMVGDGVSLERLILTAYGLTDFELDNRLPPARDRYRVSVVAPVRDRGAARELLRSSLERSFNFRAVWESRPMDVVVLRRLPNVEDEGFQPATGDVEGMAGRMGFHVSGVPMEFIAEALGSLVFHALVIDETNLDGTYRLDVDWQMDDTDSAVAALRGVGLEVIRETRDVRVLVVEPSGSP